MLPPKRNASGIRFLQRCRGLGHCAVLLVSISVCFWSATTVHAEPPTEKVAEAKKIQTWIEELDADAFATRENAMQQLILLGASGLKPLAKVADGRSAEASARAITVLESLSRAKDLEVRLAALEQLVELKNHEKVRKNATARLAVHIQKRILKNFLAKKGRINDSRQFAGISSETPYALTIGSDWKGTNKEIKDLRYITSVELISFHGCDVSKDAVLSLKEVPRLRQIQLFGTLLSDKDCIALKKELAPIVVDVRKGAFLGIRGSSLIGNGNGAVIDSVQPNSAAQKAGLKDGDVVTKINKATIKTFEDLTTEIGKLKAGDKATLEINRGGKTLIKEVKFEKWS